MSIVVKSARNPHNSLSSLIDSIQSNISKALESGKDLHVETTASLEPEERRMVGRSGNKQMATYIVFAIALTASPWLPFSDAVFEYQVAASIVFAVGMSTLLYFLRRRMLEVYDNTPKQIIRGIVTSKNTERSKKSSTIHYYITVGTDEMGVEGDVYRRYQVGDTVEFHYWSGWGTFVLQHRQWNPGQ